MRRLKMSEFGFHGRLTEDFPSQLIVDITEVCNLACVHCPHPSFKQSEHYTGKFLDVELNKKMVDEVKRDGKNCKYIRYTSNGEPLVHPKAYQIINYAVENSGTFVCITTNGTIMKEKKTKQLLDSGIHMIDISIDAFTNKTYSDIRVGGNLDITRENVSRLIKWSEGTDTKVVVSFIEQPNNTHEIDDFRKFWQDQGAIVVIRRLHSAAGAVANVAEKMNEKQKDVERYPCLYPWERLVLDPKGFLAFCPADWTYSSPVADFKTTTIKEAWQGVYMQKLREAHLSNDYSCHRFCGQCPDWSQTRWPNQGEAYADLVEKIKGESDEEV